MQINEKIKKRRLELGLTLQELAEKVGVGTTTIHYWEQGRTDKMKLDYLLLLAKALKVSPQSLFHDEDELEVLPTEKLYSQQELDQELMKLVIALPFQDKIALYNKLNNISKEDKSEK